MDVTIVIDETVSRELTEHNMVAKRAGFNQQRKNTLLTMPLRNAITHAHGLVLPPLNNNDITTNNNILQKSNVHTLSHPEPGFYNFTILLGQLCFSMHVHKTNGYNHL